MQRLFGSPPGKSSKEVAKDRLQSVLVQDRVRALGPSLTPTLRHEILRVLGQYLDVDEATAQVQWDRHGDRVTLVASIPVKRVKRSV